MSVFDLPTSGAQIGAIAIELIFCIFAIIVASVRIYARQKLKMLGWGKPTFADPVPQLTNKLLQTMRLYVLQQPLA